MTEIADDLPRSAPQTSGVAFEGAFASPSDLEACRELLRGGSRSFFAASFLLPETMAAPAASLYAFCRVADDAVDLGDAAAGLAEMRCRLERIYAEDPADHAADRAFADVVRHYRIPKVLPEALLDGFAWDAQGREYHELSELVAYSARVAGTVGAMMTLIMGRRESSVLARACDLGVAMQLTNICRDVGEDAQNGRLYLPRAWLREQGLDPDEFLADPRHSPELGEVVRRLLHAARRLYRRASTGIKALPARCQPGIHAARLIYAEIGEQLIQEGLDSVSRRTVVGWQRKLLLLGRALAATFGGAPTRLEAPALAETHFLVDAVQPATAPQTATTTYQELLTEIDADTRGFAWAIDLFVRLEARERSADDGPALGVGDAPQEAMSTAPM